MALNLDLATAVWRHLMPEFVHCVTSIRFESSPKRHSEYYLNDGTAWDTVIDVITLDGQQGCIAAEWKNVEQFQGAAPSPNPRYQAAAHAADLFIDPDAPELYRAGCEQLRREHNLLQLMVQRGLAARGRFVLIGPRLNPRVAAAARTYTAHLIDPAGLAEQRVGFQHIEAETILAALTAAGASELAQALHRRYFDLDRVATLALGDDFPSPPATPAPLLLLPPPAKSDAAASMDPATPPAEPPLTPPSTTRRRTARSRRLASSQAPQVANAAGHRRTLPHPTRRARPAHREEVRR